MSEVVATAWAEKSCALLLFTLFPGHQFASGPHPTLWSFPLEKRAPGLRGMARWGIRPLAPHLGHSLSSCPVAMATYISWGGRPVSCSSGLGRAVGVAQGPVGGQSRCLTQPGRWERAGREVETRRRRRQGWRVTEGGHEVFQ